MVTVFGGQIECEDIPGDDPALVFLHEGLGSNIASDRSFRYGDPEAAFAAAAHRVTVRVDYPRNSCTPRRSQCSNRAPGYARC